MINSFFTIDVEINISILKIFYVCIIFIFFLSIFKLQNNIGSAVSFKVLIRCIYMTKRTLVCIPFIFKLQNYVYLLTALEASFVPFQSTGNPLFCSVNRFATFRAFWMFHGLERHFYTEKETLLSRISYYTEISHKVNHYHLKSRNYCSVINYYF